jgi:hypothetical protein
LTLWNFIGLEELDNNFPQIQTLWNFIGLEELDNFPKFKHFGTSLDLKNSTTSPNSTLSNLTTSSNSTLFEFQFGAPLKLDNFPKFKHFLSPTTNVNQVA